MASRRLFSIARVLFLMIVVLAAFGLPVQRSEARIEIGPRRFTFKIDPATALEDLLPIAPKTLSVLPPYLNEDLLQVPEVTLGNPLGKLPKSKDDPEEEMAHFIAKINHLNKPDPDGFLKALIANRSDLRGLPFLMGKDCRMEVKRAQLFAETVAVIERHLQEVAQSDPEAASVPNKKYTEALYWRNLDKVMADKGSDAKSHRSQTSKDELDHAGRIGLVQMIAPKSAPYRVVLAKYLATVEHAEATRELARLALFSPQENVRTAAIDGLKARPAHDYAKVLLQGFRYPLPEVSTRAAEALVALRCKDVLADLVDILEQPDPRAPAKQQVDGKDLTVVRELVRVNHHRNCLLCHAPANTEGVPRDVLTAPVTLPSAPLNRGYRGGGLSPDIFVRIDVTYLRQDFSMLMPVKKEMQRFDFLVRTRVLSAAAAAECATLLAKQGTPPSHRAAGYALRELTGRDPEAATPEAWRRVLKLAQR